MTVKDKAPAQQPAQLAKLALRRLAEQRLEPTPENFQKAYLAEAGDTPAAAARPSAPAQVADPSEEGERWSSLIARILRGAERGGRQWTSARKKDSLQRVLESSKSSATRLQQRLSQLVSSWDSDTLDNSLSEDKPATETAPAPSRALQAAATPSPSPAPTLAGPSVPATSDVTPAPDPALSTRYALAQHTITALGHTLSTALSGSQAAAQEAARNLHNAVEAGLQATVSDPDVAPLQDALNRSCEQARRVIEHRHHLIDQLTELCHSLTDSMADLSEDESWVQGQCALMRHHLDEGLNHRGLRHMQQLLADTRKRQRTLKLERENARQALKGMIHQMLQEVAELGQTTDRFQGKLGSYVDTISHADSVESLTDLVREMIEDGQVVQTAVTQAQTRLHSEHEKATALSERVQQLEDEIRKLSAEVSTDPLTQIANRRGMQKAFEVEHARAERSGTALAIALLDVDNFKKLNDQLGHQTGDEALKFLARRVSECLRPIDVVARYGGEEFVVMLPDTQDEAAQAALTRLQRTLSAEFFTHDEHKVFITFSAGVTTYRLGEAIEAALERADVALYEAKRTGKNRTCIG